MDTLKADEKKVHRKKHLIVQSVAEECITHRSTAQLPSIFIGERLTLCYFPIDSYPVNPWLDLFSPLFSPSLLFSFFFASSRNSPQRSCKHRIELDAPVDTTLLRDRPASSSRVIRSKHRHCYTGGTSQSPRGMFRPLFAAQGCSALKNVLLQLQHVSFDPCSEDFLFLTCLSP